MQSYQTYWSKSVRILAGDTSDLVRTCRGSVGHPEAVFAGRIEAVEEHLDTGYQAMAKAVDLTVLVPKQ